MGNANLIIETPGAEAIKCCFAFSQSENAHLLCLQDNCAAKGETCIAGDGWRLDLHRNGGLHGNGDLNGARGGELASPPVPVNGIKARGRKAQPGIRN